MAELQIKIAADVGDAVRGLNQVDNALEQTGKEAVAVTNSVNKASQSLSKLPQSANQASMSINNLGRIVQDAPYGFIGIQNNIGPLIDSFGYLKASTGSTGAAIKALAGSLIGPAGIGLAVSAVTAALTFAITGFSSWTKGLTGAKQATDKLAESLAMDLVQLTTIVGLAQNVSASTQDREKAVKLLNEEYSKYLPNLDKEGISLNNINDSYKKIIDSMLQQAVVKGLQEEIAKQVQETAKQLVALKIAQEQERIALEKSNKQKVIAGVTLNQYANDSLRRNRVISDGNLAIIKQTQAEKAAIGTTNVYDMMVKGLTNSLMETLNPALNLVTAFSSLDKQLKKGATAKFDFSPIVAFSALTIEEGRQADMFARGNIYTKEYQKKIAENFKKLKDIKVQINIDPELVQTQKNFKKAQDEFTALVGGLADSFNTAITSGLSGIAESIGQAIGGDDIANSIINTFSTLLSTIGKALISYGIAKEGLDKILGPAGFAIPGAAAIGLGIAAVAASTLLKSFGGARATGGPVDSNKTYLVGEKGPELFVPNVPGQIVPNDQIPSFGGGLAAMMTTSGGRGGSLLRGQDIILAYARTQRSQLRVNG
jgi:hypothetical protein